MARAKKLNVFFDIETVTVNRKAEPKHQQVMEYVVSYKYKLKGHVYEKLAPNLEFFINDLLKLPVKNYILLAHNGEKYDFSFLYRKLIIEFGLSPKNMYVRQSLNHELESKIQDEKGDYLHVQRLRSSTRTALKFRIKNKTFETKDTLPITHMSVRTIGGLLKDLGLDENGKNIKLNYDDDYTKYDKKEKMSYKDLKAYCLKIFNQLTDSAKDYVLNDTRVIYAMYQNYNKIYASSYDPSKLTLSQNILEQYKLNPLASFQLLNEYQEKKRLELTNFIFQKVQGSNYENVFEFIHHFYKGGLNMYNDKYIGKIIKGHIVHIDLNSSYPTVMRYREFPTFAVDGGNINKDLTLDNKYYYFIQISKIAFQNLIVKRIKSRVVRQMFVKYFNNGTDSVFLQTPHLELISDFLGEKITKLPVISFMKFIKEPFGGLQTIQYNYHKKTQAKINHESKGAVAGYKVTLNGIYGIPALRPFFPLYETDKNGKVVSVKDDLGNNAFHNKERNITFACSVTAYAIKQLLEPLTKNIGGIDDNFYYCDTDSIFMSFDYWNSVKDKVKVDKYKLGAWDMEHKYITDLYVMNHKKYALFSKDNNKVEVFAGGIPIKSFKAENYKTLKDFVKATFHDGVKIKNLRNAFTKDKVIVLYEAETQINIGNKYIDHFPRNKSELLKSKLSYSVIMTMMAQNEEKLQDDNSVLYYETELGTFSYNDIFPPIYQNNLASKLNLKSFFDMENLIKQRIEENTDIEEIEKLRRKELQI